MYGFYISENNIIPPWQNNVNICDMLKHWVNKDGDVGWLVMCILHMLLFPVD